VPEETGEAGTHEYRAVGGGLRHGDFVAFGQPDGLGGGVAVEGHAGGGIQRLGVAQGAAPDIGRPEVDVVGPAQHRDGRAHVDHEFAQVERGDVSVGEVDDGVAGDVKGAEIEDGTGVAEQQGTGAHLEGAVESEVVRDLKRAGAGENHGAVAQ